MLHEEGSPSWNEESQEKVQVRDVRDPPAVRAVAMHTRLRGGSENVFAEERST